MTFSERTLCGICIYGSLVGESWSELGMESGAFFVL